MYSQNPLARAKAEIMFLPPIQSTSIGHWPLGQLQLVGYGSQIAFGPVAMTSDPAPSDGSVSVAGFVTSATKMPSDASHLTQPRTCRALLALSTIPRTGTHRTLTLRCTLCNPHIVQTDRTQASTPQGHSTRKSVISQVMR